MSDVKKAVSSNPDTARKTQTNDNKKNETKEKARKKTKAEAFMYLGPDIKGIVRHGEIFRDEGGEAFLEMQKKIPVLKELYVPIAEAGKKFVELKTGGSASKLYDAAVQQMRKGEADE